jgi:flagellar motor protein MotB
MSETEKKAAPPAEEGGGESAPLWIISFADMISLLMAFFVMLSTFNSFDNQEEKKLEAVIDSAMLPNGGWFQEQPRNSVTWEYQDDNQPEGSEKPTQEHPTPSRSVSKTDSRDFRKFKVFDIPSGTMFVSSSSVLTEEGRKWLDLMATFLTKIPGGIVIAEQGPDLSYESSMKRVMTVVRYLKSKGISSGRLNISGRGTLPSRQYRQQAILEVCILDETVKQ